MKIPAITSNRLIKSIPKFKRILKRASERDVNESDTVTIITDMLEEIFGFDKYSEITREYAIKGTFCDLAIKIGKNIDYLIEAKAIGTTLNENHLRQAVNYAATEGVRWVVLTNGLIWHIYHVKLNKKVTTELLCTLDFATINPKKPVDQEDLFLLCKRGVQKNQIDELLEYRKSVNSYNIGALIMSEPVLATIRRELRKFTPGIKVDIPEIKEIVESEIIKRDVSHSEDGLSAQKTVSNFYKKMERSKKSVSPKAV